MVNIWIIGVDGGFVDGIDGIRTKIDKIMVGLEIIAKTTLIEAETCLCHKVERASYLVVRGEDMSECHRVATVLNETLKVAVEFQRVGCLEVPLPHLSVSIDPSLLKMQTIEEELPDCDICGQKMRLNSSGYKCHNCGATLGCF